MSHLLQFFAYAHLPSHLQAISKPFHELATTLLAELPMNAETTVMLRKLMEAKDCAVRAKIFKQDFDTTPRPVLARPLPVSAWRDHPPLGRAAVEPNDLRSLDALKLTAGKAALAEWILSDSNSTAINGGTIEIRDNVDTGTIDVVSTRTLEVVNTAEYELPQPVVGSQSQD